MTKHALRRGATVLVPGTHGNLDKHHLCIVLTDPTVIEPHQVLYAPVITARANCDTTCLLNVGDHPFIAHRSCVHYARAQIRNSSHLLRVGTLRKPLDDSVSKGCATVFSTPFTPLLMPRRSLMITLIDNRHGHYGLFLCQLSAKNSNYPSGYAKAP